MIDIAFPMYKNAVMLLTECALIFYCEKDLEKVLTFS